MAQRICAVFLQEVNSYKTGRCFVLKIFLNAVHFRSSGVRGPLRCWFCRGGGNYALGRAALPTNAKLPENARSEHGPVRLTLCLPRARAQGFSFGAKAEAKGRERWWCSWGGEGQQVSSPTARGSGERCELPQRGSGRSLDRQKGFPLFSELRI